MKKVIVIIIRWHYFMTRIVAELINNFDFKLRHFKASFTFLCTYLYCNGDTQQIINRYQRSEDPCSRLQNRIRKQRD